MAKNGRGWKDLEKLTAALLKGERKLRGADFSKSEIDVAVKDFPFLMVDSKCYARHAHHTLLREIAKKYCTATNHVPVLVTRENRKRPVNVTVSLVFFAWLLDQHRAMRKALFQAAAAPGQSVEEYIKQPVTYNPEGMQILADDVEFNDGPGEEKIDDED